MTTVFIGGSRAVSRLNAVIRQKLDDLMSRQCVFFVGDANGADKAVQGYLAAVGYQNVVVYCMDTCRNNLGNWPANHITTPGTPRNFAYYAAKDQKMTQDAKCGVMLWDGKSKGTLNNIQELLAAGKKTLVYLAPRQTFHKLSSQQDLEDLLRLCEPEHIQEAQRQIRTKLGNTRHSPGLENQLASTSLTRP